MSSLLDCLQTIFNTAVRLILCDFCNSAWHAALASCTAVNSIQTLLVCLQLSAGLCTQQAGNPTRVVANDSNPNRSYPVTKSIVSTLQQTAYHFGE